MNIESNKQSSTHSHIKGLSSLIGQPQAIESTQLILQLIQESKLSGRSILFTGPTGTGKTAIALALSNELKVPFTSTIASQVYSHQSNKSEYLTILMRQSIAIKIKEIKQVYEGQLTQYDVIEDTDPLNGYSKIISHLQITLKSQKGSKQLKLDASMYHAFQSNHIQLNDVIYIESNSGLVKRCGKSDAFANEYDLENETYVPIPKGDVFKSKTVIQTVTLHDLDESNTSNDPVNGSLTQLNASGISNSRILSSSKTSKLRNEINKVVNEYINQGIAELCPGVLFIDECHLLDVECWAFLNKAMESPIAPIIIYATNKGHCLIKGTDEMGSHGVPSDMLDRLLIIKTNPFNIVEMKEIIACKSIEDDLKWTDAELDELSQLGMKYGIRYALQCMEYYYLMKHDTELGEMTDVTLDDVTGLFMDAGTSAGLLEGK
eukprot:NODE_654_length_4980_cov_0.656833.p2 type:complete len:434 gc:universal NODE_654_length_4980_cov_0.656833:700-2001(+)